jgi:outer membrane receptor for ferrienterochelin and colicins
MLKNIFLVAVLFLFAFVGNLESKSKLTLIDDENGNTIAYAKFIARKKINNIDSVISQMTNKLGTATIDFDIPFSIEVNQTGYEPLNKSIEKSEELTVHLLRKVFYIDEIVTTGQYTPQSTQKSVFKVNAITEERIIAQSAFNLRELMMTEMNIRVSQDNILGSSMSINGLSGQNVKIMVDGVPVVGRLNGNVDLSQINLNNARRVEVIEGPMSAMYGTDALGGVVNIITKDIIDDNYYFNANSFYESVGTYNFDFLTGANFGKNNVILSGGRNFFGGYSEVDTSRFQRWKPKEQYFGDWQYNVFWESISFRYHGQYFNEFILNRGNPRLPYGETAFDDHYKTTRWTNTISLKGEVAKNRFFDIIGNFSTFSRLKNTYFKDLVTLKERLTVDPSDQDTNRFNNWMLRANYSHDNILKNVSYQAGIDFHLSTATGKRIDVNEREVGDYALYASSQISSIDNLIIQPSVRLIHNTNYEAPVVPSLNLKYDLTDEISLRGSYAKGFRAPSLQELHFMFVDINHNIIGNTDLKAETSDSYIFGFNYHATSELHSFKIEQTLFYNNVKDLISLANVRQDIYSYINIGEFNTMGTNIALSYVRSDLNSKIGFSYTGRQYKANQVVGSTDVVFTPEIMGNIIYDLPIAELRLNAFYKYTGKLVGFFAVSDVEYAQFEVDDYHTLDLTLSRNFFDNLVMVNFGLKNIFDVKDVERSATGTGGVHSDSGTSNPISWGRTITASIRINVN